MSDAPVAEDVRAAAARIKGLAHRTPVLRSRTLDDRVGATLFFKAETFQRTGAFKFRGAANAIARLTPEQRRLGVVAFSSGNHAQAIALAARCADVPAVIVMPKDAPAIKLEATRGYGAEIVLYDRYAEDRQAIGARLADERGLTLIPPFDHPDIIAGQGTAALELLEETGPLDLLLAPLGGGGLLAGTALAASLLSPDCRVIGVEPEAGDDGKRSFAAGRIISIPVPATIADGAQTTALGQLTFRIIRERVTAIETATDEQLRSTMRTLATRMKLVVEPTGCLAAAAVLEGVVPVAGKRVGIILSGGNVDFGSL
ncbi:threonine dehydratase [Acetobacter nitrogenifigens DSM 23921 = NBRC 105050]|uniref:Serine/threonine dehydratase n=1 Tax=Acetobacter nitrogenifigens DSM 23921 = NBRC 105050 TaxID=1120919 RepID=A0A511X9L5_9PROT|nr:threo-3-hydroxy-L-aspartate ammonia-lyase [Acetobacter nitrogenifigens]GBQ93664.1 threonine dehydratase [Acetobacter nitrogenifigens DSM 23921 = NBRC 105050]GEN59638.1 serine/threonine dehydratase [Acetobacter nitrogenifigens DSM 23921 = NBRC 105050]